MQPVGRSGETSSSDEQPEKQSLPSDVRSVGSRKEVSDEQLWKDWLPSAVMLSVTSAEARAVQPAQK